MIAALSLLALAVQTPAAPAAPAAPPAELVIELPPGAVHDAWERRRTLPEFAPSRFDPSLDPSLDEWERWALLVEQRNVGELALLAAAQGRWDDAWRHWVASADARGGLGLLEARRTLAPLLVGHPLVPASDTVHPIAVPDGAVLRPAMPPPPGAYSRSRTAVRGLRIGAATVDLEVALELDGVQIDVTHVAGGACRVSIALPTIAQFSIAQVYADWEERAVAGGAPIELSIQPGDERHTLWGRFGVRENPWPTRVPAQLPASVARAGIAILCNGDDPRRAELARFATALARLTGARVALVAPVPALADADAGAWPSEAGLRIDLRAQEPLPDVERDLKWLALASLAERYWLAAHPQ
ncbi:MAG: hypothetical protein EPO68_07130 [Planctomycetota bacterium]|nr:MAG: hypothetical protein EPO68_07130 [Planctomycetota bacterium]